MTWPNEWKPIFRPHGYRIGVALLSIFLGGGFALMVIGYLPMRLPEEASPTILDATWVDQLIFGYGLLLIGSGVFLLLNQQLGWYLLLLALILTVASTGLYAFLVFVIFVYSTFAEASSKELLWAMMGLTLFWSSVSLFFYFRAKAVYWKWNTYFRRCQRSLTIA